MWCGASLVVHVLLVLCFLCVCAQTLFVHSVFAIFPHLLHFCFSLLLPHLPRSPSFSPLFDVSMRVCACACCCLYTSVCECVVLRLIMKWWFIVRECVYVWVYVCVGVCVCLCVHECVCKCVYMSCWVSCVLLDHVVQHVCMVYLSPSSPSCQFAFAPPFLFLFTVSVSHGCCHHVVLAMCHSLCWSVFYSPLLFHVSQGQSRYTTLLPVCQFPYLIHCWFTHIYCSHCLLAYRHRRRPD